MRSLRRMAGFLLLLVLSSTQGYPNPILYNIVSEFRPSPDSLEQIELHWVPETPPDIGDSVDIGGWEIATLSGTAIIDSGIILTADGYVTIDSTNTSGTFELGDQEDSISVRTGSAYDVTDVVYPSYWVPAPPSGASTALCFERFFVWPGEWEEVSYWYVDPTPTFGDPNDDYTGSISGTVYDQLGRVVEGALVKTVVDRWYLYEEAYSNGVGEYMICSLFQGTYTIEASAQGYNTQTYPDPVAVMAHENTPEINFCLTLTGVESELSTEKRTTYLDLNVYPNPLSTYAHIAYALPETGDPDGRLVAIGIYDLAGRLVRTLVDSKKTQGHYTVLWDGRDSSGNCMSSGIYLCRAEASGHALVDRIVLVR